MTAACQVLAFFCVFLGTLFGWALHGAYQLYKDRPPVWQFVHNNTPQFNRDVLVVNQHGVHAVCLLTTEGYWIESTKSREKPVEYEIIRWREIPRD